MAGAIIDEEEKRRYDAPAVVPSYEKSLQYNTERYLQHILKMHVS